MKRLRDSTCVSPGVYSTPARGASIQIVASTTTSGLPLYLLDVQSDVVSTDGYKRREHACAQLSLSDLAALERLLTGLHIAAAEADEAADARQLGLWGVAA